MKFPDGLMRRLPPGSACKAHAKKNVHVVIEDCRRNDVSILTTDP